VTGLMDEESVNFNDTNVNDNTALELYQAFGYSRLNGERQSSKFIQDAEFISPGHAKNLRKTNFRVLNESSLDLKKDKNNTSTVSDSPMNFSRIMSE